MTKKQKKTLYRILLSAVITVGLHFIPSSGIVHFLLYLIPYLIIGYDVLKKAVLGIINREIFDENFLMAIATVGAFALGSYGEGVEVMLFYQIGELFQSYAVGKSRKNITALMDIRPDYANIETNGQIEQVDPDEVAVDDVIIIRPGEKVPLDGIILEGTSTLNTSALTGESLPREVAPGDAIISGCVNTSGLLKVRVTKAFEESTVAKILELVENSSLRKAKAENFITKFAHYYTPAVCIGAALLAFIPPFFVGNFAEWFRRALTFLVISCPCALVISIPLSFFGGIGGASRSGILVKGGNYLEALASTRTVVFDKTGTLTKGVFAVSKAVPAEGFSCEELLTTAALAESYSVHPISKSLRDAAMAIDNAATTALDSSADRGGMFSAFSDNSAENGDILNASRVSDVEEIAGHGVLAKVDGQPVAVGSARLMERLSIPYQPLEGIGTVVYAAIGSDAVGADQTASAGWRFAGAVLISDQIKPTAKEAISGLQAQGVRTVMLTGDASAAADAVGKQLNIDEIHSELLPADKVTKVEQLLSQKPARSTLAFVGDGINDAPVLSRADIGIAMGAMGSDAAIEAADIVLMDDDPAKIALAMRISRKCLRIVRQNIVFALGVKALCLILGALGLAGMQAAIFADVGVMVLAVLNAMRTLRA